MSDQQESGMDPEIDVAEPELSEQDLAQYLPANEPDDADPSEDAPVEDPDDVPTDVDDQEDA